MEKILLSRKSNTRRTKNVCEDLEKRGYEITYLPVYESGVVKIKDVKNAVQEDTILITIMTANNEIGTIQPVEKSGNLFWH